MLTTCFTNTQYTLAFYAKVQHKFGNAPPPRESPHIFERDPWGEFSDSPDAALQLMPPLANGLIKLISQFEPIEWPLFAI